LAVALSRLALDDRVQVDIYESTAELTQMGAGITLCPRGWEIIRDLSLDKDLAGRLAPGETSPDCEELSGCFTFSPKESAVDCFITVIKQSYVSC
jgi:salicylate hydroxylase